MGIVIRQSLKASLVSYIGVGIGVINQLYVSTQFLSVEQLGLSRLLLENSLLFASFAHIGAPFIADKFFPFFRSDKEEHHGILPFLLSLPLAGGVLFAFLYLLLTPAIKDYFSVESPMLVKYHLLVLPLTLFYMYFNVLEAYSRNNSRIAIPNAIREVYLKLANLLLVLLFGLGWYSFELMLYLMVASYALAAVILVIYLVHLKKWYWRKVDRNILTKSFLKETLAYGGFTILGGLGVNVILFIDRSMLAGEEGLVSTGIFIIAGYIAGTIEIPKRAITQISVPLLSDSIKNKNIRHVNELYQKSALHQLLAGGLIFLLIWASIDDIFFLLPKGDVYERGKIVVLLLALVKIFDVGTGPSGEIMLYSPRYKTVTYLVVVSAILGIALNAWLIPLYGITGAAIATTITTALYSLARMALVWFTYHIFPFSKKAIVVVTILLVFYIMTMLVPSPEQTRASALTSLFLRSGILVALFLFIIVRLRISPEINASWKTLQNWLKNQR